jgi:hypothetical protein
MRLLVLLNASITEIHRGVEGIDDCSGLIRIEIYGCGISEAELVALGQTLTEHSSLNILESNDIVSPWHGGRYTDPSPNMW